MRIIDVNELYSPTGGGVRTYIDRKFDIMADLGHELIVIAPGKRDYVEERPGGGRIFWQASVPLFLDLNYRIFARVNAIRRLLDELQPDVVETCTPWVPALAIRNWKGTAPKVYFAHNDNVNTYGPAWFPMLGHEQHERIGRGYTNWMKMMLRPYDAFVTNGPTIAKSFAARGFKVDAAMPLGIERGHFSPDLRDEKLREALLAQVGLPKEGMLLLGLGRHHNEKRWPMVIDAVEAAGGSVPVGLIMLGDGPARRRIERRIEGSPHIKLFRPVYDRQRLAQIVASCDALIHGSSTEPFGLVAHEALASGLPLIVPDRGGSSEIADPLYAETYHADDRNSCAAAIRRLCMREPAILRAAARNASRVERTDRDHVIELMEFYAQLAGKAQAKRLTA